SGSATSRTSAMPRCSSHPTKRATSPASRSSSMAARSCRNRSKRWKRSDGERGMTAHTMPLAEVLKHVGELANASLPPWGVPEGATTRLINVSENATYLVEADDGFRSVLRVHRPDYHTRRGIEQELAWARALAEDGMVRTPEPIAGVNGELVQEGRLNGTQQ